MPITAQQLDQPETDFNKLLKISFWGSLFVAVGLFAVVYLAPAYVTYQNLKVERYDNQVKLVTLEHYIQYLGNASEVLQQNSQQVKVTASQPLLLSSVVDENFQLDPQLLQPVKEIPQATTPGHMHYLELLAGNVSTRQSMMATATFILLFGFVFLQDSSAAKLQAAAARVGNCFRWITTRYSQEEIEENVEDEFDE